MLARALPGVESGAVVAADRLNNRASGVSIDTSNASAAPCVASIYQLDPLVRRATSLQLTADARRAHAKTSAQEGVAA